MKHMLYVLSIILLGFTAAQAASVTFTMTDYSGSTLLSDKADICFIANDNMAYAEPGYDDQSWQKVSLPDDWSRRLPEHFAISWYRFKVQMPQGVPPRSLGIELGYIGDTDELYFNGTLIGSSGIIGDPREAAYDKKRFYQIPTNLIRPGEANVFALRVHGRNFKSSNGPARGYFQIAPYDRIQRAVLMTDMTDMMFIMVYIVFSVYFFTFFIGRRKEYENLVFSLFSLDVSLYFFLRTQIKHHLELDFYYCKKIEYVALSLVFVLFLDFITLYFKHKRNYLHYIAYAINVLCIMFFVLSSDYSWWSIVNQKVMQPVWIIMVPLAMYIMFKNLKKDRDARYMLGGFAFLFLCSLNDIFVDRGLSPMPRLSNYGFLGFIGGLGIILNQRFIRLHHDVEDLNRNLEKKVQQRTEELQQTLEEVQALKVQQDGDYFLTSLLMRPLGSIAVESEQVLVHQYVRQKKTFIFKDKKYDIGGDLNVVHSVRLLGRDYIAFLNSDAMGKSIQGAGGALITGVIVNSYLHRTKVSSAYSNKHPERWLKDCYQDLQAVFETFDGSMLTSLVFGLLDIEQGLLYHINAEHPWGVLYRQGQAMFIEHEQFLRKIGIQLHIAEKEFRVQTLLLEPGDILVFGSDGRDDVVIDEDIENGRVINEDETLFLGLVEKSGADIESLAEVIAETGEITDDLSLISLQWNPADPVGVDRLALDDLSEEYRDTLNRIHELVRSGNTTDSLAAIDSLPQELIWHPEVLKLRLKALLRAREYQKAAELAGTYAEKAPRDTELLYLVSYVYKCARKLSLALDYGERVHLRRPDHEKNLVNLADIYRMSGLKEKARSLIQNVLEKNPDNRQALRISNHLDGVV